MTPESAQHFAETWVKSWNTHDLDGILEHYAEEVTFTSPFARLLDNSTGTIQGRAALRQYFSRALTLYPELHFELLEVFVSVDSIVLYYRSVLNLNAAETMAFNADGQVIRAVAHYANS